MTTHSNDGHTIKSNRTLFSIIEVMKETNKTGITEIANELDLAKGTVHKHLVSLEEEGYAIKSEGKYRLSLQFLNDGVYVRNRYGVYDKARTKLDGLVSKTGIPAMLTVHENGRGMFITGSSPSDIHAPELEIGKWRPLHAIAGGKAIMAYLPDTDVEAIIDEWGLPSYTENTITDHDTLFKELETIREQGFAFSLEESKYNLNAVGMPIVMDDDPLAAIVIGGPPSQVNEEYCRTELVGLLESTINDIELLLSSQH